MLYRSKLFEIVKTHLPEIHCYADDTEVYISLVRPAFSLTTHGKFVDDNLNLNDDKICGPVFLYLYNIRRIRNYLSQTSTETLVHALVPSRLDHCNSLLYGLPDSLPNKLQRVQNACA